MQVAAVVAGLLVPGAGFAQSGTATISGVVRDSSGAAIPGATLRVVNEGTSGASEAVSGESGVYRVEGLAPGRYRVEAALDGFETAIVAGRAGATGRRRRTTSP